MYSQPINDETVVASGTFTSDGQTLSHAVSGFSIYYEITGDGTADFFHYVSVDGENFVREDRAIKRGLTKTSGPGGDGKGMLYVPVMPCNAVKVEVVETAGANSIVVTAKLASRIGRFGDVPVYDGVTSAINTIGYEHHEIHSGSHFFVTGYQDLAANDVLDFTWLIPDTTKWVHWTFHIDTESETLWQIYENVVATNALANAVTPNNSNRNSTKSSGTTMKFEHQADLAAANADTNVTGGTLIASGISGSGKDAGQDKRSNEMIMKQATLYCLRATANAAGFVDFDMQWYEHTNR